MDGLGEPPPGFGEREVGLAEMDRFISDSLGAEIELDFSVPKLQAGALDHLTAVPDTTAAFTPEEVRRWRVIPINLSVDAQSRPHLIVATDQPDAIAPYSADREAIETKVPGGSVSVVGVTTDDLEQAIERLYPTPR